eukprot:349772-Chlamydomonas_euryale.AAC.1
MSCGRSRGASANQARPCGGRARRRGCRRRHRRAGRCRRRHCRGCRRRRRRNAPGPAGCKTWGRAASCAAGCQ